LAAIGMQLWQRHMLARKIQAGVQANAPRPKRRTK